MELILSHKIRLKPNKEQSTYLAKAAGVSRFAYNWALSQWCEQYKAGHKPTESALRKHLNSVKRDEFPWMLEVTKCAPQQAVKDLGTAFKRFFKKKGKYPKFHKKGLNDSFYLDNINVRLDDKFIKIPLLKQPIKMTERLRLDGKLMSATISRRANYWFVSLNVKVNSADHLKQAENQGTVGVDLGVKDLAILSNGEKFTSAKPYKHLRRRLRRSQQSLSRKKKGSNNRFKAKQKLALLHYRISCIRNDFMHKLTSDITTRFNVIGIEDLNVDGMLKNHRLSKSISDMAFGEFRRQIEYKSAMRNRLVVMADRFFASSKLCSKCGRKHEQLKLSDRKWVCEHCGSVHDRDINAALNLKQNAERSSVSACGEFLEPNRLCEAGILT